MLSLFASLALTLSLVAAPGPIAPRVAPEIRPPVATMTEANAAIVAVVGAAGRCGPDTVFAVILEVTGIQYGLYVSDSRFVLFDNREGDTTPAWLGDIKEGKLVVKERMTFAELQVRYPNLCSFFGGA